MPAGKWLGTDLRLLHFVVEVLWSAVVVLFGQPYLATFYVAAFRGSSDGGQVCPSANGCGSFTGWLTLANLIPAVLIALGYLGSQTQEQHVRPKQRREPPHWYKHLYWSGSALGLALIFVQVVFALIGLNMLQAAGSVLTSSDGNTTTVQVSLSSPTSQSRLLAELQDDEVAEGISLAYGSRHDEEGPSGRVTHASCVGPDDESTRQCAEAFEMASGWTQIDCVGSSESARLGCIYIANNGLRPRTCAGNSNPADDVQCTYPATLVSDSPTREASDEQGCCEKVGLCRGNTDGSPDVECEPPATLLPSDTRGRDSTSCCATPTCAQIECVPPKVSKALDPSTIPGSTVEECCVCAEDGERDLVDAYCVSKDDPNPEAENGCTDVMKYIGCGRFEHGQWVSRSTHCVEHPEDPACAACKSEPPYLEFQRLAETAGSAQDLCMDADRYTCRYVFRRSLEVVSCRQGMCFNNTFADSEPDIICPPPSARKSNALDRVGRDVEACCTTRGMCIQDTDGEPDIECEFPSRLRPNAAQIIGRDQATCCHVTEMCVGNTDQLAEPNTVCHFPAVLRPDASHRFRREVNPCGGCCVTEGMCIGNDICESEVDRLHPAQRDIECRSPSERVPDAAVTRGRDTKSCCRTVGRCVGNTDGTPDVHCTWPAMLRNNAEVLFGRTTEECCLTQGMCVGNSNPELEPDVVCEFPAVALENIANIEGRTSSDCCIVTGYCAGNTDPAEEDIKCEDPRTPKGNLKAIKGRSYDACCDCFEIEEEVSEEYCVLTENSEPELDNHCTRVMKYAGCDDMEACIQQPDLPACIVCAEHDQVAGHSAFQIMARDHHAQDLCMAAGRYECTYIYDLDQVTRNPCLVTGHCVGNTDSVAEPDVVCPAPTTLRQDVAVILGNSKEECCTKTGYCVANSDPLERDIVCPPHSVLRGVLHRGRSEAECCVTHGMCVGNSRAEEPDYDCPAPYQLRANAAEVRGRSMDACCWCEEHTELVQRAFCVKTSLPDPETDNECTEVMRYADCPVSCIENGYSIVETEQMLPDCAACAQSPPYATWQQQAHDGIAQDRCMAASRFGCTYTIEDEHRTTGCELVDTVASHVMESPLPSETCECQHSKQGWLELARHPATDEPQVMHAYSVFLLLAFLLGHFGLRLYEVLWHYSHYKYHSPCIPDDTLDEKRGARGVGRDDDGKDRRGDEEEELIDGEDERSRII